MRRRFLFVYNADSGLWNLLQEAAHKVLSPATYPCHLCALTYGALGMKRRWAAYVQTLPGDVGFLHRDELAHAHPQRPPALPALLEDDRGTLITLLGPDAIGACRDLDALIAAVRGAVATAASGRA